jgi:hypothetical protein
MEVESCIELEFGVCKNGQWHGDSVHVVLLVPNFKASIESPVLRNFAYSCYFSEAR